VFAALNLLTTKKLEFVASQRENALKPMYFQGMASASSWVYLRPGWIGLDDDAMLF
jgi:hypothetical protein